MRQFPRNYWFWISRLEWCCEKFSWTQRNPENCYVSCVFLVVMFRLTCRNNPSSQQISFHVPAVADCPELNPDPKCKVVITSHSGCYSPLPPDSLSQDWILIRCPMPNFLSIFVKLTFCCQFFPCNSDFPALRDPTGPESCSSYLLIMTDLGEIFDGRRRNDLLGQSMSRPYAEGASRLMAHHTLLPSFQLINLSDPANCIFMMTSYSWECILTHRRI